MEKQDLQRALSFIEEQIQRADTAAKRLKQYFEVILQDDLRTHVTARQELEQSYIKYIHLLNKYQADKELTPLDVFPGIHTTSSLRNTEEMQKDTVEMEQLAKRVKQILGSIEKEEYYLMNDLSTAVKAASAYHQDTADIRAALSQLLTELDSVYDVGLLSKNS